MRPNLYYLMAQEKPRFFASALNLRILALKLTEILFTMIALRLRVARHIRASRKEFRELFYGASKTTLLRYTTLFAHTCAYCSLFHTSGWATCCIETKTLTPHGISFGERNS